MFSALRLAIRDVAWPVALALLVVTSAGCRRNATPPPPPPVPVTVSQPIQREVVDWDEYTGHLEAPETVEVRARVGGLILQAPFTEGALVRAGDLLFLIDPSPYQADLEAKQAAVAQAEAQVAVKQVTLNRIQQAGPGVAVSKQDYDNAVADLKVAQATLAGSKAAAMAAQLNVEWCRVVAPIAGRTSNKNVNIGNLITGGTAQATLLTTITSLDPIYCYVNVDERSVLKYQRLAQEQKRASAREQRIPCFLQLANETNFPHLGVVDFVDNRVDPNTGTLRARGVFANSDHNLLPGLYARMRVPGSGRYRALLIPDVAVGTDQNEKYVLIVDAQNKVQRRRVTPGALHGKLRAIDEGADGGVDAGIKADDWVVVNGMMRVRPGMVVDPHPRPIPPEMVEQTAPGSPATQALPATRLSIPEPTTTAVTQPIGGPTPAATAPATQPAGGTP